MSDFGAVIFLVCMLVFAYFNCKQRIRLWQEDLHKGMFYPTPLEWALLALIGCYWYFETYFNV